MNFPWSGICRPSQTDPVTACWWTDCYSRCMFSSLNKSLIPVMLFQISLRADHQTWGSSLIYIHIGPLWDFHAVSLKSRTKAENSLLHLSGRLPENAAILVIIWPCRIMSPYVDPIFEQGLVSDEQGTRFCMLRYPDLTSSMAKQGALFRQVIFV